MLYLGLTKGVRIDSVISILARVVMSFVFPFDFCNPMVILNLRQPRLPKQIRQFSYPTPTVLAWMGTCTVPGKPEREKTDTICQQLSSVTFILERSIHIIYIDLGLKNKSISDISRSRYVSSYKVHKVIFSRFAPSSHILVTRQHILPFLSYEDKGVPQNCWVHLPPGGVQIPQLLLQHTWPDGQTFEPHVKARTSGVLGQSSWVHCPPGLVQ